MTGFGEDTGASPIIATPSLPALNAEPTPGLSTDTSSDSEQDEHAGEWEEETKKILTESAEDLEVNYYRNDDLRKWCHGQPPKPSYLTGNTGLPTRFRMSRRNTMADKPELDLLLAATKVWYNGHAFLPLTAQTIHRLDPFFKGAKPLADLSLFKCIIINQEINSVHADHVVTALERIGEYCKHLLVMSPVQTSELGNVFAREAGNISPGNDWDGILGCFPNLEYLAFVHDVGESVVLSRNTFRGLKQAVANRQAIQEDLKGVYFNGPLALLM